MLRATGSTVRLKLVRYVHGLKFEQLQQAIASSAATSPIGAVGSSGAVAVGSPTHQQHAVFATRRVLRV